MSGFNLPPGCSDADIPENGDYGARMDAILDALSDLGLADDVLEKIVDRIEPLMDKAEQRAVSVALANERMTAEAARLARRDSDDYAATY